MEKIVNATPHAIKIIKIVDNEGIVVQVYTPSELIIRCSMNSEVVGEINGIQLTKTSYGEVVGLPAQKAGVYYIVSTLVQQSSDRTDLLVPSGQVRNEQGIIIGCKSLGVKA